MVVKNHLKYIYHMMVILHLAIENIPIAKLQYIGAD